MNIQQALIEQARLHPQMEPRDLFKFLYQAVFGCEHLMTDPDEMLRRIQEEEKSLSPQKRSVEPLGEHYSRIPLGLLDPKTLGHLFCRSAKEGPKGTVEQLEEVLATGEVLVKKGYFSFDWLAFSRALTLWKEQGYPALHHSSAYRNAYSPAYRVVENRYLPFLPLFSKIDRALAQGAFTLAIEGGSASGKSTLGALLEQRYDCTLFHMDDFFLRPEQRTPARFAEAGGNVDWERFLEEVLTPLAQNKPIAYRRFDCASGALLPPEIIHPRPLRVIEGVYSMHPQLAGAYDFSVFLEIDPAQQRARIEKRNSAPMAERFFKEWIPLEQDYFQKLQIKERCTLII